MTERLSTTESIYQQMLDNIRRGAWATGESIPSERQLIEQFGASRIAIREALSMLRGLGVLDISHGRRTRVRGVSIETFDQLLPLMLSAGSQKTFDQVFELRLALELQTALLAARNRTEEQLAEIQLLAKRYRQQVEASPQEAVRTDLEFHQAIAQASGNPLLSSILTATTKLVAFTQIKSCAHDPRRWKKAARAHQAIASAITDQDGELARSEMEAHLRFSASRQLESQQTEPLGATSQQG